VASNHIAAANGIDCSSSRGRALPHRYPQGSPCTPYVVWKATHATAGNDFESIDGSARRRPRVSYWKRGDVHDSHNLASSLGSNPLSIRRRPPSLRDSHSRRSGLEQPPVVQGIGKRDVMAACEAAFD
jgi:hypothetical protein